MAVAEQSGGSDAATGNADAGRRDGWLQGFFAPRWHMPLLLLLCLAVYLPGVLRLPAVDRTEVIWAETTRSMIAGRDWLSPHYGASVHQFRPIGTYWAQGTAATLASAITGTDQFRNISVYRLPGMLAVMLAVVALYLLSRPMIGASAALVAGGLFAVAPLTVLLSQLAIAESLTLLPATVAMLALLRLYQPPRSPQPSPPASESGSLGLALLFWVGLGAAMLLNALLVPIIAAVTVIGLWFMDRDLGWLRRLHAGKFVWLALLIAAPWLFVRFHQDGVPFAGMSFKEIVEALGGAQDMKLRAMPGTFVLALLLGFLPGTALAAPAMLDMWTVRRGDTGQARLARFLLAWVVGYLIYLELLSAKPGTYMVQTMFPALAIAVATLAVAKDGIVPPPRLNGFVWPAIAALFAVVLFALPYGALREWPAPWLLAPMAVVVGLFYVSAGKGRQGALSAWAASGIAALGLFAVTLIAGVFPSIPRIWPSAELQKALATCQPGPVALFGFNEPSAWFLSGADRTLSTAAGLKQIANGEVAGYAVIEQGWYDRHSHMLSRTEKSQIQPLACFNAVNTMRGCRVSLTVTGREGAVGCAPPPQYACTVDFMMDSIRKDALKPCD